MKLPQRLTAWLARTLHDRIAARRPPDFVIGTQARPYLLRWFVIPRNAVFNIYLHQFQRDDDDRALHDHPWVNVSVLLDGGYIEHTIAAGGIHHHRRRNAGDVALRTPWTAHRIELLPNTPNPANAFETWPRLPCWTLFITGPRMRAWGFHCPERGWVHWEKFTSKDDRGAIGKGCDA